MCNIGKYQDIKKSKHEINDTFAQIIYTVNFTRLIFLFAAIILSACSKEQMVFNKLEGRWKLISFQDGDSTATYVDGSYSKFFVFNKCIKGETCRYVTTEVENGSVIYTSDPEKFRVHDEGNSLIIFGDYYVITMLTKTNLVLSNDSGLVYTLKKNL